MKSQHLLLTGIILFLAIGSFSQVAINEDNSNPDPSAMLDVQSIDKGVLVSRLTSTQREAIASPANGLLVWDSDTESFWFFNQIKWIELIDRGNSPWSTNTNNDIYTISSKVGIGTINPSRQLHSYSNNSNLNTSPFLIEQAGVGDAFFNIGLTGSHFYNLGVDQSDGGKFKIGYNSSQPYGVALNTRFTLTTSGQVGIGTSSPSDRMQVDADAAEPAFRVRQGGATKLRVHTNGGLSVGVNSTPPVDGLLVTGAIQPWGNIITDQNLLIESTGVGTSVQLKTSPNYLFLDGAGLFGYSQDVLIMETANQSNKVEMNALGLTTSSALDILISSALANSSISLGNQGIITSTSQDIIIETTNATGTITIKIGANEINIEENGGIVINSSGNDLTINTNGGNLTLDSDNGDITLDSGNGDINLNGDNMDFVASGSYDISSNGAMLIRSINSTLGLQSNAAMNLNSTNSSLTAQSATNLKLNAGLTLDLDGTNNMTLNAPTINLNNGVFGAARMQDPVFANPGGTILSGSSSVRIGN